MNKIQLVSRVMRTMKDKEEIKAKVKVEGSAPDTEFSFSKIVDPDKMHNHHECHQGHMKRFRNMGHDGMDKREMKRAFMEENGQGRAEMKRAFMEENGQGRAEMKQTFMDAKGKGRPNRSWRSKFDMMSTGFDIFNSIKVTDLEDGMKELILSDKELSDELVERIKETIKSKHGEIKDLHPGISEEEKVAFRENTSQQHNFKKHLKDMNNVTFSARFLVNEASEVTEVEINASGDIPEGPCTFKGTANIL